MSQFLSGAFIVLLDVVELVAQRMMGEKIVVGSCFGVIRRIKQVGRDLLTNKGKVQVAFASGVSSLREIAPDLSTNESLFRFLLFQLDVDHGASDPIFGGCAIHDFGLLYIRDGCIFQ